MKQLKQFSSICQGERSETCWKAKYQVTLWENTEKEERVQAVIWTVTRPGVILGNYIWAFTGAESTGNFESSKLTQSSENKLESKS